jgi:hypothetical protein
MQGMRGILAGLILAFLPLSVFAGAGAIPARYPANFTGPPNLPIPFTIPTTGSDGNSYIGLNVESGTMTSAGTTVTSNFASTSISINPGATLTNTSTSGYALLLSNSAPSNTVNINGTLSGVGNVSLNASLGVTANANNATVNVNGTLTNTAGGPALIALGSVNVNVAGTVAERMIITTGSFILNGSGTTRNLSSTGASAIQLNGSGNVIGNISQGSGSLFERNSTGVATGIGVFGSNSTLRIGGSATSNPVSGTINLSSGCAIYYSSGTFTNPMTSSGGNSTFYPLVSYTQNQAFSGINIQTASGVTYTQNNVVTGLSNFNIAGNSSYVVGAGQTLASSSSGTINANSTLQLNSGSTFTTPTTFSNSGTTFLIGTANITNAFTGNSSSSLVLSGSTWSTAAAISVGSFTAIAASNFTLNNNLTTSGTGGVFIDGGNTMNVASNAIITNATNASTLLFGDIKIGSGITLSTPSDFTLYDGGTITDTTVNGSFTQSGNSTFTYESTSPTAMSFTGTFTNSGATALFNQDATLPMTFAIAGNVNIAGDKTLTTTGTVNFTSNAIQDAPGTDAGNYTNSGIFNYNYAGSPNGLLFTGLFTNSAAATFNVNESVTRGYTTANYGAIIIDDTETFTNTGTMTQYTGGSIAPSGTTGIFANTGTFNMDGGTLTARINNSGSPGIFNLSTSLTPVANSQNSASFFVKTGGVLTLANLFTNTGTVQNQSTTGSVGAPTLIITGTLDGNTTGKVKNDSGAFMAAGGVGASTNNTIYNAGNLNINGILTNNGYIYNGYDGSGSSPSATNPSAVMTIGASISGTTGGTGVATIINYGQLTVSTTCSNANTLQNYNTMNIDSTRVFTNTGAFTNNVGATLNINGTLTGSGSQNLFGTTNVASTGTLTGSGPLTLGSGGAINLAGNLDFTNYTSFADSGTIYVLNGGTTTGNITVASGSGSSFVVGRNSSGTVSNATYSTSGTINGMANFDIAGGSSFTANSAISNMTGTFLVESNGTATINAGLSGTGSVNNQGTFNLLSTLNVSGGVTNSGTFVFGTAAVNQSSITNSGTINVSGASANQGAIVNNGSMNVNAALTNSNTITNNNSFIVSAAGSINNSSTITNTKTMSISGNISNTGSILNSGGEAGLTISNITNTNSITNSGGSIAIDTALLGAGSVTNSSGTVSLTSVNLANTLDNYANLTINTALSGTGVVTNYSSGVVTVNSAAISNSNTYVNQGSFYFNGSSTLSGPVSNTGTFYLNSNATLQTEGNFGLTSVNNFSGSLIGNGSNTTLVVSNTSDFYTNATINLVNNIRIDTGTTMRLQSGATVSNFSSFEINGNLSIENGATLNIGVGDNFFGNGSLTNSGVLNINGSNLTLGGNFTNNTSGVFQIFGVPTLNFGGDFINNGSIITTFNESNSLPQININGTYTLTNGTIAIGYSGNYIANGFYPFINAAGVGMGSIGGYQLPQPNIYITNWALAIQGNSIGVQVTRRGFGDVATTPEAKRVGYYLDSLGANNPSQAVLDLLNGLQRITNPTELDAALLDILPPDNVPIQSLNMLELMPLQDHIFQLPFHNVGFFIPRTELVGAGDANTSYGAWIRPYGSSAQQNTKGSLLGYKARTNGVIGGFDNQLSDKLLLGIAGSYTKATVTQEATDSSITRIKNYQVLLYSSYRSDSYAYLDSLFSIGTNNYQGSRYMNITTYQAVADSRYSGQQLSAKVMASKNYRLLRYYQFTPMASAQYSFVRQLPYQESNAGPFNRVVEPNNINLLQLGVGAQFSVPFDEGKITGIPAVYGMLLVDAQGGALTTNTTFISGGPILTNTVQAGRLVARLGMSMNFKISDHVEAIGNYNVEFRSKYLCNEVFLNLRYVF